MFWVLSIRLKSNHPKVAPIPWGLLCCSHSAAQCLPWVQGWNHANVVSKQGWTTPRPLLFLSLPGRPQEDGPPLCTAVLLKVSSWLTGSLSLPLSPLCLLKEGSGPGLCKAPRDNFIILVLCKSNLIESLRFHFCSDATWLVRKSSGADGPDMCSVPEVERLHCWPGPSFFSAGNAWKRYRHSPLMIFF